MNSLMTVAGLFALTVSAGAQTGGIFVPTGNMAESRLSHTAALLRDGKVLVTGGVGPAGYFGGKYLTSAEIYDPATGQFSPAGDMNNPRAWHSATLLKDGRVLIIGGDVGLGTAETYDPATGLFAATGSPNFPQRHHSATLLRNGKVLIAGGAARFDFGEAAEIYDPATGAFAVAGPVGGSLSTAALLADGRVLITGGLNQHVGSLYDPSVSTFRPTGTQSTYPWGPEFGFGVCGHTTTSLPNGKVLVAGGGEDLYADILMPYAELYDPVTDSFTPTGAMNWSRGAHSATLLPGGKVLIAGGCCFITSSRYAEVYDPLTETFSRTGEMQVEHGGHTSTLLKDGTVLIAGGGYLEFASHPLDHGTVRAELYMPAPSVVSTATLSNAIAPGSLASVFGARLEGITLRLRDAAGEKRPARVVSASPSRIDFEVPPGTAVGFAALEIENEAHAVREVRVKVVDIAPQIFVYDDGRAIGYAIRLEVDGMQTVLQAGADIVLGDRPTFLVLKATGIRNRSSLEGVQCTIGGISVPVEYAGPQETPGIDQVNIRLLPALIGNRDLRLVLTVDAHQANAVSVDFRFVGR